MVVLCLVIAYFCHMLVAPERMPDDSRIWIYQANRKFSDTEVSEINSLAKKFVESWTAHNNELKGSFELVHNLFLILMIDEKHAMASGCSIDKSIHLIRGIEKTFDVSMLDRQVYAYFNNEEVLIVSVKEFERLIESGSIDSNTIVFNNLITKKIELQSMWKIPMGLSWHKNLFNLVK